MPLLLLTAILFSVAAEEEHHAAAHELACLRELLSGFTQGIHTAVFADAGGEA